MKYNTFKCLIERKKEKSIIDVKPKKGRMRAILGIPDGDTISDHYTSGRVLAKALVDKVGKKEAAGMLAYVANIDSDDNLFDVALRALKDIN
jgi:hypothetical protein